MNDTPTREPDPTEARNFAGILATIEDGRFHADLSDAQRELVSALDEATQLSRKAKGSMTVTLEYTVEDGVMEVRAEFKAKTPKLARGKTVFFVTPENNLTRRDPKQPALPFRDVTVPRAAAGLA